MNKGNLELTFGQFLFVFNMESNKVIVFDCGGVLANDTPNYVFKAIAENYPPSSKEKISNIFKSK